MKHFKKILVFLMAFSMVLTLFAGMTFAAEPSMNISAETSETVLSVGETFTVTVSTSEMTTSTFTGGLSYDSDVVEFVGYEGKKAGETNKVFLKTDGTSYVELFAEEGENEDTFGFGVAGSGETVYEGGELVDVTFRAVGAGNPDIKLYENSDGASGVAVESVNPGFSILVNEPTLQSITILTQPTKTAYHSGEVFDKTGLSVTATYSDSSVQTKTAEDLSFTSKALNTLDTAVEISYTENDVTKTVNVTITVSPHNFTSSPCTHKCSVCNADEPSITVTDGSGIVHEIHECEIKAATSVTVTQAEPWIYNPGASQKTAYGTFYSLSSVLSTAGIDYSEAHGIKLVATDGFVTGLTVEQVNSTYIYDMAEVTSDGKIAGKPGTFGTAINGSAGNKWAKDVASGTVVSDHVWFVKKGACKHYCAICNANESLITVTDGEGTAHEIHECEIKAATSVTVTETDPWTYTSGDTTKNAYGTFYSLSSVLSTAGIDYSEAHGIKLVATDGFVTGLTVEQVNSTYIYDMSEVTKDGSVAGTKGTFGTAINGSAGNKWANNVASGTVVNDHVWFVKKGACKHYCAICNESEPTEVTIEWAADFSANFLVKYKDCGTLKETVAATVTSEETVPPTYETTGLRTYTAKATIGGTEYTETKTEVIPKKALPEVEKIFTDVKKDDWFYESVQYVYAKDLMKGVGGTNEFQPGALLNRAQFAVILYRMEGEPAVTAENVFPDVPEGEWFTNAVIWANKNKIITGYIDGRFGAGDPITREQLATMLYRYANYKGLPTTGRADLSGYPDANQISDWALEPLQWAVDAGIITGKEDGKYIAPGGNALRCECATMLKRFMTK